MAALFDLHRFNRFISVTANFPEQALQRTVSTTAHAAAAEIRFDLRIKTIYNGLRTSLLTAVCVCVCEF